MVWVCVSPPNLYVETLTPYVIVWGSGVFGRCLSQESGAFLNGVSGLIKEAPGSSEPASVLRGCSETSAMGREPSPAHTDTQLSNFQPPRLWEINFCCPIYLLPSLWCFYSSLNIVSQLAYTNLKQHSKCHLVCISNIEQEYKDGHILNKYSFKNILFI